MKILVITLSLFTLFCFNSCRKEDSTSAATGFIKTIVSDSDAAVVNSFRMEDGNYLVAFRDMESADSGSMVKLTPGGNILWRKRLSSLNRVLWKLFPVPGNNFVTVGHDAGTANEIIVCTYNNDGEFMSSNTIAIPCQTGVTAPFDVLMLKNGNFAFAGCDNVLFFKGYLIITDNTFSTLYTRTFDVFPPGYSGCFFRGICEMSDSTLAITASTTFVNDPITAWTNILLFRTSLTGILQSTTLLNDSINSETPNAIVTNGSIMLSVTSRMTGWPSGHGAFVNYYNNRNGQLISGKISLNRFNSSGQLISRTPVSGYPGNGMMNSMRPTSDGGYILCGTVNQESIVSLVSNTKIFLLKIDSGFNIQWQRIINTTYPSYGVDAFQTDDGGYFIAGQENTFNKKFQTIVIRTDTEGNIN